MGDKTIRNWEKGLGSRLPQNGQKLIPTDDEADPASPS